jgi:hypothetical protein
LLPALLLFAITLVGVGKPVVYARRVVMNFEPGSSELPQAGMATLGSVVDDAGRDCLEGSYIAVEVDEVVVLPLGKVTGGPTPRTQRVAAALRELSKSTIQPYEASLAPGSERAHRMGLKPDQVAVELLCPPRGT